MREKELRRSLAVFPIGTVMKLTDLTARQIRYYEEQELIHPERSEGNRNMAGIKRVYQMRQEEVKAAKEKPPLTDKDVRRIFYDEMLTQGGFQQQNPYQSQGPKL